MCDFPLSMLKDQDSGRGEKSDVFYRYRHQNLSEMMRQNKTDVGRFRKNVGEYVNDVNPIT